MITKKAYYKSLALIILITLFLIYRHVPNKSRQTTINNTAIKTSNDMKFILIWTLNSTEPFRMLKSGQRAFTEAGCPIDRCFVTSNKNYLGDYTNFDAILFHGPEYAFKGIFEPTRRKPFQKYIFASVESANNYPVCDQSRDGFFNWTWTYRLDSDEPWRPITVRNLNGDVVGPKVNMQWLKNMRPVSGELKTRFLGRRKAAAWFVSNCETNSEREKFIDMLRKELARYKLKVDMYGACGLRNCPRSGETRQDCEDMLGRDYYFYMALENSFSEDYVTEKVLHGYRNYVVPIVYGGANYTRFLPPHSYIDALDTNAKGLAALMHQLMKSPQQYHEYFRYTNHYVVQHSEDSVDTHQFCRFCAALHDTERMQRVTVYDKFREWWNGPDMRQICALEPLY